MERITMAVFNDPDLAEQAIYELEHFGYQPVEIIVEKSGDSYESRGQVVAKSALAGLMAGFAVGAVAGVLGGLGFAPALTNLFIGGPVTGLLGLAGLAALVVSGVITGMIAGLVVGALTGLGLPLESSEIFQYTLDQGGKVVGLIDPTEQTMEAQAMLKRHGAVAMSIAVEPVAPPAAETQPGRRPADRYEPVFGETRWVDDVRPRRGKR